MGIEFFLDAKYGNVTKGPDNETHVGDAILLINQDIPLFVAKMLISSEKGRIVMNNTLRVCDQKFIEKMTRLASTYMDASKNTTIGPQKVRCPLHKVWMIRG